MFTSNLDDQEVQLLIVALRYWRSHRTGGLVRRTDPQLAPEAIDILLAKLMALTSLPTDRATDRGPANDPFAELPDRDASAVEL